MNRTLFSLLLGLVMLGAPASAQSDAGWKKIFDGKTLNGWKAIENPGNWTVEDGAIVGRNGRSHLFYMEEECENCEFKAEVKLNHGGNSGMFFRAKFETAWPTGYEAQVNNTHKDPQRTGTLYNLAKVTDQLVPDDTWWTQHILVNGNRIIVKVNDKTVVDFVDEKNLHQKGYLAIQQHHLGSEVRYRNIEMKKLK